MFEKILSGIGKFLKSSEEKNFLKIFEDIVKGL